jgi:response regulator RpfG family c-di-GMP phosphodiesterase
MRKAMQTDHLYRTLLIVDDEDLILDLHKKQLHSESYKILTATSGASGLQLVQAHKVGVIVSDQSMPGMDGIAFLDKVRELDEEAVFIMLTGNGAIENVLMAVNQLQIFSYIMKPWSAPVLQSTIRNAFQHYETCSVYKQTVKRWMYKSEHLDKENKKLAEYTKELEMKLEQLKELGHPLQNK